MISSRVSILVILLSLRGARVGAAQEGSSFVDQVLRARAAMAAGDPRAARDALRAADSLAPGHPGVLLQLARAHARARDHADALRVLERLAPLGLAGDPRRDSLFAPLWGDADFQRVAARLVANAAPRVRSDTALALDDPDLTPESVAFDPRTGAYFLGSLYRNRIVRVGADGVAREFAVLGAEGRGRVIGIKLDARRNLLWAAAIQYDSVAPRTPVGPGGWTALHAFSLDGGREIVRLAPRDHAGPHLFNDIALSPGGEVYVTDQWGDAVLRVNARGDGLERVLGGGAAGFHWPNGISVSPDGRRIYVAHAEGISAGEARTGRLIPLPHPPGVPLADTDGLYACRNSLVAVQRAADFQQVVRLRLSPDGGRVTGGEVLERRHPAYDQPTTGVTVGDALLYVANSQFPRVGADGSLAPSPRAAGAVVLRLPLGAGCR